MKSAMIIETPSLMPRAGNILIGKWSTPFQCRPPPYWYESGLPLTVNHVPMKKKRNHRSTPRNGLASVMRLGSKIAKPMSTEPMQIAFLSIAGSSGGSNAAHSGRNAIPITTPNAAARLGFIAANAAPVMGTHISRMR